MQSPTAQAIETLLSKRRQIDKRHALVRSKINEVRKNLQILEQQAHELNLSVENINCTINLLSNDQLPSMLATNLEAPNLADTQTSVGDPGDTSEAKSSSEAFSNDGDLSGSPTEHPSLATIEYTSGKRVPMDMLNSEFKQLYVEKPNLRLGDIVATVLHRLEKPVDTEKLTKLIYEPESEEEFRRARNSLSSELRDGCKREQPQWRKLDRKTYVSIRWQSPQLPDANRYIEQNAVDLESREMVSQSSQLISQS